MTHSLLLLAFTMPQAHLVVPVAIFVAITTGAWWAMNFFGDRSEPMFDERLEHLRYPRGKAPEKLSAEDKAKKKSDALTAALERATQPLATKVTGNEAEMSKLRERLLHAGFRREASPVVFKGSQVLLGLVGLFLGGVFGLVTEGFTFKLVLRALLGGGLLYYLPELALTLASKKRKEAIFLGLPDALDLMVVCVEAGLGLDQALRKVGEEMVKSHKVIAEEMNVANQQMQFGRPRSEVLQALGYRCGVDDLKQLASILIQADKFGSSVGQALRVQSDAMRVKRRQMAEEKAAKTAVKMIFPLVLFIFPGIFVVLVGPAAINMYRNLLTM